MTLFIADISQTTRASIINLLAGSAGMEVVGTACSVSEALNGVSRLRPDVILLDYQLCKQCSLDLIPLLKAGQPALRVVLLADHPFAHVPKERQAAAAGADLFLDKSHEFYRLTEHLSDLCSATESR